MGRPAWAPGDNRLLGRRPGRPSGRHAWSACGLPWTIIARGRWTPSELPEMAPSGLALACPSGRAPRRAGRPGGLAPCVPIQTGPGGQTPLSPDPGGCARPSPGRDVGPVPSRTAQDPPRGPPHLDVGGALQTGLGAALGAPPKPQPCFWPVGDHTLLPATEEGEPTPAPQPRTPSPRAHRARRPPHRSVPLSRGGGGGQRGATRPVSPHRHGRQEVRNRGTVPMERSIRTGGRVLLRIMG